MQKVQNDSPPYMIFMLWKVSLHWVLIKFPYPVLWPRAFVGPGFLLPLKKKGVGL